MKKVILKDVVDINPRRIISKGDITHYVPMSNLDENKRKIQEVEERKYKGSGSRFMNGDTLFARITPCLENGKTAFVDVLSENEVAHGSTEFIVFRGKVGLTDNLYVYYLARSDRFRRYAIKSMTGTSGRQRVQIGSIENYEFLLPPLDEQKRIAHILGTLDDKIELNQRMNETLEAIARAIFKSWFVDFDPVKAKMVGEPYPLPDEIMALFPDELVESEMGMIPMGWEVVQLKKFGEIVTGKTPSTKNPSYYDSKDIPFIKIPDMHDQLFITSTTNNLSKKGADSQNKKYLPAKSICVSCIATPGLVAMTTELSQTNQQINSIIPCNNKTTYFLLLALANKGEQIRRYGSGGSVVENLNKSDFSEIKIIKPQLDIIKNFNERISPLFSHIICQQNQNSSLSLITGNLLNFLIH